MADLYEVLEHAVAHGWTLEEAQGDLEFALGELFGEEEGQVIAPYVSPGRAQ